MRMRGQTGRCLWPAVVDEFVSRIKKDGRLNNAASKHGLGPIGSLKMATRTQLLPHQRIFRRASGQGQHTGAGGAPLPR